ncbi:MAG: hypothetical protein JWM84_3676 [Nocardioides sp.]|nr:hypothetical protein [Nocardioides sp.]
MTFDDAWRSTVAVLGLLGVCLTVLLAAHVPVRKDAVVAATRAVLQLTLVALLIAWVFRHPGAAALYLVVMLLVASVTSARRIGCPRRLFPAVALAVGAGAMVALAAVLVSGALDPRAETILPFTAQVIGGSMTAASLTGGRMRDDVHDTWGEIEAGLALGLSPRQAVEDVSRRSVARALVPALDQTRSAGLVVLPGAFVGLLLGGASPAEAAQLQLLVLVGLLAAEAVAAVLTATLLAPWLGGARPGRAG